MNNIAIKVDGMFCDNCEKRIKSSLEKLSDIEEVSANCIRGEVEI